MAKEKARELTPQEIVRELDRYIIGQDKAKKSVAIALRNRWRRQQVPDELREEITPNNIIMIGPTGVGKTEIARRLANLANAPFVKVEASKYTEVGYVGRDVESMVRDLVDLAVNMVRRQKTEEVEKKAKVMAEERLLDLLLPPLPPKEGPEDPQLLEKRQRSREKLKLQMQEGKLEERMVEIEIPNERFPMIEIFSPIGMEEMGINMQEVFGGMLPKRRKRKKVSFREARRILEQEEAGKLIDMDEVISEAKFKVENSGIIFIDEIDKIAGPPSKTGPDVSREGVQRDILPIVEGSTVATKYGIVRTDHILFIAAGAFSSSKPSDLIPELQGRFPIRAELKSLSEDDFFRILTEPQNALIKQYTALLNAERVDITFTKSAIRAIARIASQVNERTENIGARRLHTVMTTLLEDILYSVPDSGIRKAKVTSQMVNNCLGKIVKDEDLSRYIL